MNNIDLTTKQCTVCQGSISATSCEVINHYLVLAQLVGQ